MSERQRKTKGMTVTMEDMVRTLLCMITFCIHTTVRLLVQFDKANDNVYLIAPCISTGNNGPGCHRDGTGARTNIYRRIVNHKYTIYIHREAVCVLEMRRGQIWSNVLIEQLCQFSAGFWRCFFDESSSALDSSWMRTRIQTSHSNCMNIDASDFARSFRFARE